MRPNIVTSLFVPGIQSINLPTHAPTTSALTTPALTAPALTTPALTTPALTTPALTTPALCSYCLPTFPCLFPHSLPLPHLQSFSAPLPFVPFCAMTDSKYTERITTDQKNYVPKTATYNSCKADMTELPQDVVSNRTFFQQPSNDSGELAFNSWNTISCSRPPSFVGNSPLGSEHQVNTITTTSSGYDLANRWIPQICSNSLLPTQFNLPGHQLPPQFQAQHPSLCFFPPLLCLPFTMPATGRLKLSHPKTTTSAPRPSACLTPMCSSVARCWRTIVDARRSVAQSILNAKGMEQIEQIGQMEFEQMEFKHMESSSGRISASDFWQSDGSSKDELMGDDKIIEETATRLEITDAYEECFVGRSGAD